MSKTKSFIKQFIATVTGDDSAAKAEKVYRQAKSALQSQISSAEGDTINLEENVINANEALALTRVNNGNMITDRPAYVANLLKAKNTVTQTEDALKAHQDKIAFLKSESENLDKEEEDTTN